MSDLFYVRGSEEPVTDALTQAIKISEVLDRDVIFRDLRDDIRPGAEMELSVLPKGPAHSLSYLQTKYNSASAAYASQSMPHIHFSKHAALFYELFDETPEQAHALVSDIARKTNMPVNVSVDGMIQITVFPQEGTAAASRSVPRPKV